MFPDCRTQDDTFSCPTFDLIPSDVAGFMEELWEFQSVFHDCVARREPRAHCLDSLVGHYRKLARKSIEPRALQVEGGAVRGMQRCLSAVRWDEEQRLWLSHQLLADAMGAPEGGLMLDESGFGKKGQDSAGGARQYGGTLGKGEHGQVGVCVGEASRQGYALADNRLFLPEVWWSAASAARRTPCNVPAELRLQSNPQWAATMVQAIAQEGLLPCKDVGADGL